VAAAAQIWAAPSSAIPMIGASGAIGGVMGGYGVLYPRARVHMVFPPFLFFTVAIPALAMLAYWFLLQVVGGLPQLSGETEGVAFWAHIGGFVAGVAVVRLLRQPERLAAHQAQPLRQTARYRF
jgi:membrane associated rhomboid family serine protease